MASSSLDSTVCTPEQLAISGASESYCYTRRQSAGLTVVSLTGFVSLAAVITILSLIVRNKWRAMRGPKADRRPLIQQPMDLFLLSLFFGDLLQSLSVVMDTKWINDGIVHVGSFCTAQGRVSAFLLRHFTQWRSSGLLQNTGQAAIAMSTFVITLHTFDRIWRRGGVQSLKLAYFIVGTIWTFLILTVSISTAVHRSPSFYAPTPYWCWINGSYPSYRIAIENFWLWMAFAVSILYIPLVLWDAGYIIPCDPQWWTFRIPTGEKRNSKQRSKLILCALAYCLPVFPMGTSRWFLLVHDNAKPLATAKPQFIIKAIFSMSGVCDVLVFKFARSGLLLFPCSSDASETASVNSKDSTLSDVNLNDVNPNDITENTEPAAATIPPKNGEPLASLVCAWIGINSLDAVWITYYIRSATDPNPRTIVNKSHQGWEVYYLTMFVFGFFWGCVNIVVWMWYFQSVDNCPRTRFSAGRDSTFSQIARFSRKWGRIGILVPVAITMGLGPFFGPVQAWLHRCDSFNGEVILNGLFFSSPNNEAPVASFYFRQPNGTLQKQYDYNLTNDAVNPSIWYFSLLPGSDSAAQIQNVTYDLDNLIFVATCPGNTTQCTQGTFQDAGYLSFLISDKASNATVADMRAVDTDWDYGRHWDDAPSYILREVNADGSLGSVVVRTAVTEPGHCTILKLCANDASIATLAPVGLTLYAQNKYSVVCTTLNSN
ncbi:hypothetical protein MSAN_01732300 [Mycena sanguinolenta]|uniref:Glucose receptor Git3 N-terminal domain-containing protein n=1 Tax=Mycena sanguinolenta TaxID=230812 RepID=A0A8H6XZ51_9AGAR|nr:hypothetical protein MSAN_01732300 [Mycena sanguinolenta]